MNVRIPIWSARAVAGRLKVRMEPADANYRPNAANQVDINVGVGSGLLQRQPDIVRWGAHPNLSWIRFSYLEQPDLRVPKASSIARRLRVSEKRVLVQTESNAIWIQVEMDRADIVTRTASTIWWGSGGFGTDGLPTPQSLYWTWFRRSSASTELRMGYPALQSLRVLHELPPSWTYVPDTHQYRVVTS